MLLLKDLPSKTSLLKLAARYPGADVKAIQEFATILRVSSDLSAALDKLLNGHGLMQGRWWVLVLLLREENLTSSPSALAEKVGVTKATMTGFINGLEREGLVSRLTHGEDGRMLKIQLTPLGQEKLDQVVPDYYRKVGALMSALSDSQRESIIEAMKILGSNISVMKV
jgi:DNA-binding MarR family transcriptional regulator